MFHHRPPTNDNNKKKKKKKKICGGGTTTRGGAASPPSFFLLFLSSSFVVAVLLSSVSLRMVAQRQEEVDGHINTADSVLRYFISGNRSDMQKKMTTTERSDSSSTADIVKAAPPAKKPQQGQRQQQQNRRRRSNATTSKQQRPRKQRKQKRPRIRDLIASNGTIMLSDNNNTQFIQSLLDFAIIGFGKCGTSTLLQWLNNAEEESSNNNSSATNSSSSNNNQTIQIKCLPNENWELMNGRPDNLIKWMYHELPSDTPDTQYKRCYKAPSDITQAHILEFYRKYWPRTKLIVSIRHPVSWFESLYNFRIQTNVSNLPPPTRLIGKCKYGMKHTCTEKGNFAYHLIRLGKHNYDGVGARPATDLENRIVGRYRKDWYNVSEAPYTPNPVFLLDLKQLSDTNLTRRNILMHDIRKFLGLGGETTTTTTTKKDKGEALPSKPQQKSVAVTIPHHRPGRTWTDDVQKVIERRKINICDDKYNAVRKDLVRLAKQTSEWIVNAFLKLPDVHVTSREYLEHILVEEYTRDPCNTGVTTSKKAILEMLFNKHKQKKKDGRRL